MPHIIDSGIKVNSGRLFEVRNGGDTVFYVNWDGALYFTGTFSVSQLNITGNTTVISSTDVVTYTVDRETGNVTTQGNITAQGTITSQNVSSGNGTFTGNIQAAGNATFGEDCSDTATFNGKIVANCEADLKANVKLGTNTSNTVEIKGKITSNLNIGNSLIINYTTGSISGASTIACTTLNCSTLGAIAGTIGTLSSTGITTGTLNATSSLAINGKNLPSALNASAGFVKLNPDGSYSTDNIPTPNLTGQGNKIVGVNAGGTDYEYLDKSTLVNTVLNNGNISWILAFNDSRNTTYYRIINSVLYVQCKLKMDFILTEQGNNANYVQNIGNINLGSYKIANSSLQVTDNSLLNLGANYQYLDEREIVNSIKFKDTAFLDASAYVICPILTKLYITKNNTSGVNNIVRLDITSEYQNNMTGNNINASTYTREADIKNSHVLFQIPLYV